MNRRTLLSTSLVLLLVPLAGCLGGDGTEAPQTNYKPTGNTVHLRMWVADMVNVEVFPGLEVNLWAFCAEPADPNDEYSRNAIEYREPAGKVQVLQSDGSFFIDEEQTQKCSVPGPQLRVQQGDKVIVDFINDHFHPHTIHWHGQFVPWLSDGVPGSTQDSVLPCGTADNPDQCSYTYEFEAKRAGTLWYHCHVDTQFHVQQGLYGVIIVEPQDDKLEPETDDEYTLVFSNAIRELVEPEPGVTDPHAAHRHGAACGLSGVPGCQNPAMSDDADIFMINGVSAPNTFMRDDTLIRIDPGETIRIRMLNAGPFTTETIHLHGHDMLVTHIDGNPIPKAARYWVDTILIGPGQRYDVIVNGEEGKEGIWVMHTHITSRVTNSHQYPGGMLTKLVYDEWLEEQGGAVTPFAGVELPGGIPYIQPYEMPDDDFTSETIHTDVAIQEAELLSYDIPVELPCGVKQVWVEADFRATTLSPLIDLNELTVELFDDDGNAVVHTVNTEDGSFTTAAAPDADGTVRFDILDWYDYDWDGNLIPEFDSYYRVRDMPMEPNTNFTLKVTGTAGAEMDVDITSMVSYYPTVESMQYWATKTAQRDTCEEIAQPGYTQYPPQARQPL